jgi:threonine dehydratase
VDGSPRSALPSLTDRFVRFHSLLAGRAVTEFSYRFFPGRTGFIICSFLLAGSSASASGPSPEARKAEIDELVQTFKENEMEALDLSEDEFAKAHVRHLVGGRAEVKDERVFRFGTSFRPGF